MKLLNQILNKISSAQFNQVHTSLGALHLIASSLGTDEDILNSFCVLAFDEVPNKNFTLKEYINRKADSKNGLNLVEKHLIAKEVSKLLKDASAFYDSELPALIKTQSNFKKLEDVNLVKTAKFGNVAFIDGKYHLVNPLTKNVTAEYIVMAGDINFAKLHEIIGEYRKADKIDNVTELDGNLILTGAPEVINELEHVIKDETGYYCEAVNEETGIEGEVPSYALKIYMGKMASETKDGVEKEALTDEQALKGLRVNRLDATNPNLLKDNPKLDPNDAVYETVEKTSAEELPEGEEEYMTPSVSEETIQKYKERGFVEEGSPEYEEFYNAGFTLKKSLIPGENGKALYTVIEIERESSKENDIEKKADEKIDFEKDLMEAGESKGEKDKVNETQLAMGKEVEKEHTTNPEIAEKITRDHLKEMPDYYTHLKEMEDNAKTNDAVEKKAEVFSQDVIQKCKKLDEQYDDQENYVMFEIIDNNIKDYYKVPSELIYDQLSKPNMYIYLDGKLLTVKEYLEVSEGPVDDIKPESAKKENIDKKAEEEKLQPGEQWATDEDMNHLMGWDVVEGNDYYQIYKHFEKNTYKIWDIDKKDWYDGQEINDLPTAEKEIENLAEGLPEKLEDGVINADDKEEKQGIKYTVNLWPGKGYQTKEFKAYATSEEDALDNVVQYLVDNELEQYFLTEEDVKQMAAEEGISEDELKDKPAFTEKYMYIDTGMGAQVYLLIENMKITKDVSEVKSSYAPFMTIDATTKGEFKIYSGEHLIGTCKTIQAAFSEEKTLFQDESGVVITYSTYDIDSELPMVWAGLRNTKAGNFILCSDAVYLEDLLSGEEKIDFLKDIKGFGGEFAKAGLDEEKIKHYEDLTNEELKKLFAKKPEAEAPVEPEAAKKDQVEKTAGESYGWVVNSEDAWDKLTLWEETVGAEQALRDVAKAMGDEELSECLAYIFRMNDFKEGCSDTDDEDSDVESAKKENIKKEAERVPGKKYKIDINSVLDEYIGAEDVGDYYLKDNNLIIESDSGKTTVTLEELGNLWGLTNPYWKYDANGEVVGFGGTYQPETNTESAKKENVEKTAERDVEHYSFNSLEELIDFLKQHGIDVLNAQIKQDADGKYILDGQFKTDEEIVEETGEEIVHSAKEENIEKKAEDNAEYFINKVTVPYSDAFKYNSVAQGLKETSLGGDKGDIYFNPSSVDFTNDSIILNNVTLVSYWEGVGVDATPEEIAAEIFSDALDSTSLNDALNVEPRYLIENNSVESSKKENINKKADEELKQFDMKQELDGQKEFEKQDDFSQVSVPEEKEDTSEVTETMEAKPEETKGESFSASEFGNNMAYIQQNNPEAFKSIMNNLKQLMVGDQQKIYDFLENWASHNFQDFTAMTREDPTYARHSQYQEQLKNNVLPKLKEMSEYKQAMEEKVSAEKGE